jgi:hypothetical protein
MFAFRRKRSAYAWSARVAAELILLPQVAYRGQEITSLRLRGLLALLADELGTGTSPRCRSGTRSAGRSGGRVRIMAR